MQKVNLTIFAFFLFASVAHAAPYFTIQASMLPKDLTENIGTTTSPWDIGFFNQICLAADCKTAWPTGGGGSGSVGTSTADTANQVTFFTSTGATPALIGGDAGLTYNAGADRLTLVYASTTAVSLGSAFITNLTFGGVSGTAWTDFCTAITGSSALCDGDDATGVAGTIAVSTSTNETKGQLSYWTTTSGTPAKLGQVATSSLLATSPLSLSGVASIIATADRTLSLDTSGTWSGNAGTATALAGNGSNCAAGFFPLGVNASGAVENCTYAFATTTPWSTGLLAVSNTGLGYTIASSSLFGYTPLNPTRQLTVSSANGTIVSSAGAQDLSADRTWTLTYTGLATTSQPASSNLLVSNGAAGVFGVATGTVSAGSSAITVTAGRSVIGGSLSIDCATASASQAGCLATADFTSFSNKLNWPWTVATTYATSTNSTTTPTWFKTALYASSTIGFPSVIDNLVAGAATTTNATTTNLSISGNLKFNGVTASTWAAFCTTITGSSALCDGDDATGVGGSAAVATSTNETAGRLSYWTTTSGTPAKLGDVSTTTLGFTSFPANLSGTLGTLVGGSNSTLTYWGLSTTTALTQGQLLYNTTGGNGVSSVATSTFTPSAEFTVGGTIGNFVGGANSTLTLATGGVALTKLATQAANTVLVNQTSGAASPTALATSTFGTGLYGTGTPGQVLMWSGSAPVWAATSTCIQITGSADLCDGSDASGGGSLSGGTAGMLSSWVDATTLTATGTPTATAYFATSTTATSTFLGHLRIGTTTDPTSGEAELSISNAVSGLGGLLISTWTNVVNAFTIKNAAGNTVLNVDTTNTGNGKLGIGTTTNPYSSLSVWGAGVTTGGTFELTNNASTTLMKVLDSGLIGVGTTSPFGLFSINPLASLGSAPRFVIGSSTGTSFFVDSAGRIGINTTAPTDTLTVNGTFNMGDWVILRCQAEGGKKTAQNTGDITGSVISTTLGYPCGDFSYIEDAAGVFDFVTAAGSQYIRMRPGTAGTINAAGDGVGLSLTTAFLTAATNTPIMETEVRLGALQNASTSLYMIGFGSMTGVSADYAAEPTDGCFFEASSSSPSTSANWWAICKTGSARTATNTNIATSTVVTGNSLHEVELRVEINSDSQAVFKVRQYGETTQTTVATITTNIPKSVLNPVISVAKVSAGNSPELHTSNHKVWYKGGLY